MFSKNLFFEIFTNTQLLIIIFIAGINYQYHLKLLTKSVQIRKLKYRYIIERKKNLLLIKILQMTVKQLFFQIRKKMRETKKFSLGY